MYQERDKLYVIILKDNCFACYIMYKTIHVLIEAFHCVEETLVRLIKHFTHVGMVDEFAYLQL